MFAQILLYPVAQYTQSGGTKLGQSPPPARLFLSVPGHSGGRCWQIPPPASQQEEWGPARGSSKECLMEITTPGRTMSAQQSSRHSWEVNQDPQLWSQGSVSG